MSATNFNTRNDTFRKLMGNGLTYRIPRFQRDYSWGEDEWEDLWMDILGTIGDGGEPAHYMGYLVLQSDNEKAYDVIDGQQRLTTLSIIVLAAMKNLQNFIDEGKEPERTKQRLDQLRQTYIGYLDPVTLVSRSKLTLNHNNDTYYQSYLVPLGHLPQRGFRASEHLLRKAFEWFNKRVKEFGHSKTDEPKALAQLVETMSDRLFFTVISVTDELNAYKVFETLNARGVRLSATDLLKNYLFSVLHRAEHHDNEMKAMEERWEAMVGRLGSESFPDFLRVHWNSRHSFVRQTELFKTIRGQIATSKDVFSLLREMEADMDVYLALTQPEASTWAATLKRFANDLRMFSVRQPFPLLTAARRQFSDEDFETLLRSCVMISFRYNVIGNLPTSEQERTYNLVAEKISRGEFSTAAQTIKALSGIYPSDQIFKAAFAEKVIRTTQARNARVVRYMLCAIERAVTKADYDFDSDSYSIEHVLPQSPDKGWDAFTEEEVEALVFRLGNMTLLDSGANRDVGNETWAVKKPVYVASCFGVTKKLGQDNADWNPERLAARQQWMANQAVAIWRVAQLS
ncbi:MAG: DUF262 domain-containing HNH endonuclease family protein [Candidatus Brocadiia bacterium]